jgi:hypothetical protein
MRRIPTSWLHQFRRLNIGADGIDSVVEVTEVFLALDDTAIAISAEIVAVPICELAVEPLQFEHVPKKTERRSAGNETVRDKAGSAVPGARLPQFGNPHEHL